MSDFEKEVREGRRRNCFYAIHPPECPGDTPKCSLELARVRAVDNLQYAEKDVRRAEDVVSVARSVLKAIENERMARAPIEVTLFVGEQQFITGTEGEFIRIKSQIAKVTGEPRLVPGLYKATLRRIP